MPTPGPLIVISGPSGSGKSKLIQLLLERTRLPLRLSVSVTTRPPRPGEIDGKHYRFWTKERFREKVAAGGFLEWAEVFGNGYGTPIEEVEPYRRTGQGVILDIDVQGWEQVRCRCPDARSIFVRASTPEVNEQRLRARGTENEETLQRRLAGARRELACADRYEFEVVNDDLDAALKQLEEITASLFEGTDHAG